MKIVWKILHLAAVLYIIYCILVDLFLFYLYLSVLLYFNSIQALTIVLALASIFYVKPLLSVIHTMQVYGHHLKEHAQKSPN